MWAIASTPGWIVTFHCCRCSWPHRADASSKPLLLSSKSLAQAISPPKRSREFCFLSAIASTFFHLLLNVVVSQVPRTQCVLRKCLSHYACIQLYWFIAWDTCRARSGNPERMWVIQRGVSNEFIDFCVKCFSKGVHSSMIKKYPTNTFRKDRTNFWKCWKRIDTSRKGDRP